jgi:antitoxin (DNA-binding transcriptional repressor) of toxin-antitoxin stability system
MHQVTVEEAQQTLPKLVKEAVGGESIFITVDHNQVLELKLSSPPKKKATFGCAKGEVWMSDDFDEPLEEFKDYM